jgi:hypothetical protein
VTLSLTEEMIRGAKLRDQARYVLTHCRARDRTEIEATGDFDETVASALHLLPHAVLSKILVHDGAPAAFVSFHALTPSSLSVAMIATDSWPHVAMAVVRWALRVARPALLAKGYRRAECRAIDGHADAIGFLRFLGFELECRMPDFGRNGETFIQLAWRLSDHVPLLETQDAAAAAQTADA